MCETCNGSDHTTNEHFDYCFQGIDIPPELRKASERICRAYNIRGQSDPVYIANVFARELRIGDGQSNFWYPVVR